MESDQPPSYFLLIGLTLQDAAVSGETLILGILLLVILLLLSAVFSGSEVALFSIEPSQREHLAASDLRSLRRVSRLLEHPRSLLNSILILNTVVNVGAAITAAVLTHDIAEAKDWSPTLTVIAEVVALTFVILVVSEITPKLIASRHPVQFARRISGVLLVLHRILFPLSAVLARLVTTFHTRFERSSEKISADDLKAMAEIGEAHGTIEKDERALIHSIVEFGQTTVREVMVSRLDIVALPAGATIPEAIALIRRSGHSRLPLFVEHLDNILGIMYAKDLLRYMTEHPDAEQIDWTRLARRAIFVPLGKKLDDLLRDFQARRTHIAVVVDEYGGTAGLVTLEDVLEEIVGEIRDEHDEAEEDLVAAVEDGAYYVDAKIDMDEMNDLIGTEIDTDAFDFETLGGLIFHLAGEIPEQGDEYEFGGLQLRVDNVENNRVLGVRVTLPNQDEDPDENGPSTSAED
ncbi:MAG: HlyC/CorC family transporter [Rhodothermales bacterium]|nr:HlyC/CorC family transporter [Rhodothermales bacterium]